MQVLVTCVDCGKQYALDGKFAGKKVKCRRCMAILDVPNQTTGQKPAAQAAVATAAPAKGNGGTAVAAKPIVPAVAARSAEAPPAIAPAKAVAAPTQTAAAPASVPAVTSAPKRVPAIPPLPMEPAPATVAAAATIAPAPTVAAAPAPAKDIPAVTQAASLTSQTSATPGGNMPFLPDFDLDLAPVPSAGAAATTVASVAAASAAPAPTMDEDDLISFLVDKKPAAPKPPGLDQELGVAPSRTKPAAKPSAPAPAVPQVPALPDMHGNGSGALSAAPPSGDLISTMCGHCGKPYQLPSRMQGKSVKCQGCGMTFLVNDPSEAQAVDDDDLAMEVGAWPTGSNAMGGFVPPSGMPPIPTMPPAGGFGAPAPSAFGALPPAPTLGGFPPSPTFSPSAGFPGSGFAGTAFPAAPAVPAAFGAAEKGASKGKKSKAGNPNIGTYFMYAGGGCFALFAMGCGLSLVMPSLGGLMAILLMLLGSAIACAGVLWRLVSAFKDDMLEGVKCMFIPLYTYYYLLTNFARLGMTGLLEFTGWSCMISAAFMILIAVARGGPDSDDYGDGPPVMFDENGEEVEFDPGNFPGDGFEADGFEGGGNQNGQGGGGFADPIPHAQNVNWKPIEQIPVPPFPDRGAPREREFGIQRFEIPMAHVQGVPGHRGKLWLYLPPGQHQPGSLPCVLIAPAGSHMFEGMILQDGDEAEHLPYAQAGMAVVAYELDGAVLQEFENAPDAVIAKSYKEYAESWAGSVNGRNALEFVLARVPEVNRNQIYAAGHSSAGTAAILLAMREPRIAGCAAFAPCTDLEKHLAPLTSDPEITAVLSQLAFFAKENSPKNHAAKLHCPLLLFGAVDDDVVSIVDVATFQAELVSKRKESEFVQTQKGGHYDAMIDQGIPTAIGWIKSGMTDVAIKGTPRDTDMRPDGFGAPDGFNPANPFPGGAPGGADPFAGGNGGLPPGAGNNPAFPGNNPAFPGNNPGFPGNPGFGPGFTPGIPDNFPNIPRNPGFGPPSFGPPSFGPPGGFPNFPRNPGMGPGFGPRFGPGFP